MNDDQRKRLQEALNIISEIADEEREKYDNMSEYFPDNERTEKLEENADKLDEAIEYINDVLEG